MLTNAKLNVFWEPNYTMTCWGDRRMEISAMCLYSQTKMSDITCPYKDFQLYFVVHYSVLNILVIERASWLQLKI